MERLILGLAVGDVIGSRGVPEGVARWTGAMAMALCIANSVGSVGWDPRDQEVQYRAWAESGHMSWDDRVPSNDELESTKYPSVCLARLAPVAIVVAQEGLGARGAARLFGESCGMGADDATVDQCVFLGLVLGHYLRCQGSGNKLGPLRAEFWADLLGRTPSLFRTEACARLLDHRKYVDMMHGDLVRMSRVFPTATCLLGALWCFVRAGTFEDGMLFARRIGGDTSAVCAVYGQLAGAWYGGDAIPLAWREAVRRTRDDLVGKVSAGLVVGGRSRLPFIL